MRRALDIEVPGRVVHVVGVLCDEVFSFVGPAVQAVGRSGREQSVVLIDQARHRHHLVRLHDAAELVLARSERNPFKQWTALHQASCKALSRGPLHAVHLHGFMAGLVGAQAVRAVHAQGTPVFVSPHGSVALAKLGSAALLLRALIGPIGARRGGAAIVNQPQESSQFEDWALSELVESPVAEPFFAVARRETRYPLIVSGGHGASPRSAERVAQLAVLLGGTDMRIGFNWVGGVDEVSAVRLAAAGVGVFDFAGEPECAARLAPAWMYLAPTAPHGFPLFLAEAMAAGLPSVAHDCGAHRQLVREGETGFLCSSERQMIERIAQLIDDPVLRLRMGAAAREAARVRFNESQFGSKLLAAYEID